MASLVELFRQVYKREPQQHELADPDIIASLRPKILELQEKEWTQHSKTRLGADGIANTAQEGIVRENIRGALRRVGNLSEGALTSRMISSENKG